MRRERKRRDTMGLFNGWDWADWLALVVIVGGAVIGAISIGGE